MKYKFGLDFGTTNSSLSIFDGEKFWVVDIDKMAVDPRVVRSMLFFVRREMGIKKNVPKMRLMANVFKQGDIEWYGEQEFKVGAEAVRAYLADNTNRRPGVKRTFFTGRYVRARDTPEAKSDLIAEVYEEYDYGTGRLLQALKSALRTSYLGTNIFGKFYSIEELIGIFVGQLKQMAERELGSDIEEITVGRPVYFSPLKALDEKAQNRLEEGIKKAGFKKVDFQFEPVGAAKSYLFAGPASSVSRRASSVALLPAATRQEHSQEHSSESPVQITLVFDFGGGTLDTALLKGDKVLATDGVYIGGDLLNADIMENKLWSYFGFNNRWGDHNLEMPRHIYQGLNSWHSIPNLNNPETRNLLETLKYRNTHVASLERLIYLIRMNLGFEIYEAIEKAKKELSIHDEAYIKFQHGPIDLYQKITRDEFEAIIQPRVNEVEDIVKRTLESAGVRASEVDIVVRTGGSSLIPVFETMLKDLFGDEKIVEYDTFTSIAAGLALP